MAEAIVIEIDAKLNDNVSGPAAKAQQALEKLKKTASNIGTKPININITANDNASKKVNKAASNAKKLGTTKADVMIGAKDKASKTIDEVSAKTKKIENTKADVAISAEDNASKTVDGVTAKAKKLGNTKAEVEVGANDKASKTVDDVTAKTKKLGNTKADVLLNARDKASQIISKVTSSVKTIAGKTWNVVISAKDKASSIISSITDKLFSLQTLAVGIFGGMAFNQGVISPIGFSDRLENSFIGFETMFKSAEQATDMMNQIKEFARTTPFETEGVINSVQQMLRSGAWDSSNVMDGIEKIGNAAAAAGKGTEGVEAIVLALQQMSMSGRVNAQDMLQLTSQGIAGWQMLADYYGKSLAEVRKMSEEGEISSEDGIKAIMKGMEAYDGMMNKISTRTASGLLSNIKDTFDLSIVEKWGKGLQSGAIDGLSKFSSWLDKISPMLDRAGASLEDIGSYISTKFFDLLEKGWIGLESILTSDEFVNADGINAKMKVLFGSIWDSIKDTLKNNAPNIGEFLGEMLSDGIINISDFISGALGDNTSGVGSVASQIGKSFWDAFTDAFDGEKVKSALWNAAKSIFSSAGKLLPGGESADIASVISAAAIGKTNQATGIGRLLIQGGGLLTRSLGKKALGSFTLNTGMNADVFTNIPSGTTIAQAFPQAAYTGKGLIGLMGKAGIALGSGASSATGLALAGTAGVAGAVAGGASLIKGFYDISQATKAFNDGNQNEGMANSISGGTAIGGVAAGAGIGAAIGSIVPVLGTGIGALIGAGVGGIAGWIGGNKLSDNYRSSKNLLQDTEEAAKFAEKYGINMDKATFSTNEMREAIRNTDISASDLDQTFQKAVKNDMARHFGDVALSLQEIDEMARKVVLGNNVQSMTAYAEAADEAEQSLSDFSFAERQLEKWNIKTKIGLDIDGDGIESYVSDIDNMVESALSYIEDKQYEANAAVTLLFGENTEDANNIISGINSMYQDIQSQISNTKLELNGYIEVASSDGIITIDEQSEIQRLTEKINNIVQSVAEATSEASSELLQLKFGDGKMTSTNFEDFQASIAQYVDEATQSYDDAFTSSLAALKLKLQIDPDFSEVDYTTSVDKLKAQYESQMNNMMIRINNIQLEIAADAYANDFNTTAENMTQALNLALKTALSTGIDPIEWTDEQLGQMLNLNDLSGMSAEVAAQLKQILSNMFNSQPMETEFDVTADPNLTVNNPEEPEINVPPMETSADVSVKPEITVTQPETTSEIIVPPMETTADVNITPNYILSQGDGPREDAMPSLQNVLNNLSPPSLSRLNVDIPVDTNYVVNSDNQLSAEDVRPTNSPETTANVTVNANYNVTPTEMPEGTISSQTATTNADVIINATYTENPYQPPHFTASTTADVSISATYTQNEPTFGPYEASATAHVTVTATYSIVNQPSFGGFGISTKEEHSATGRIAKTPILSWLAEEGYPEAVIPFNPARRGRALSLWYETGRHLGVMNNANGGIIGNNPTPLPSSATSDIKIGTSGSNSGSSVTVKLDKGSIQINITADSSQTVSEAIENQKETIANEIAGVFNKALGAQFANMPVKVTK